MHTVSWMLSFSRGVPCWVAPGAFSCKSDPYNQSNELRVFTHSPSYTHMSTYIHTHTHTHTHACIPFCGRLHFRGGWLVGLLLGPCPAKVTHTIKVMNFVYLHTHQPTHTWACTYTHTHTCTHTVFWTLSFPQGVPSWVASVAFSCQNEQQLQSMHLFCVYISFQMGFYACCKNWLNQRWVSGRMGVN